MIQNEQALRRIVLLKSFVEIEPLSDDAFLQLRETLTRIGIANKKTKTLTQTCFVLHKQGRYYIVHFLELFMLDGRCESISDDDINRRNAIACTLNAWNLCKIISGCDPSIKYESKFFVLKHSEKTAWTCVQKYTIGGDKIYGTD